MTTNCILRRFDRNVLQWGTLLYIQRIITDDDKLHTSMLRQEPELQRPQAGNSIIYTKNHGLEMTDKLHTSTLGQEPELIICCLSSVDFRKFERLLTDT